MTKKFAKYRKLRVGGKATSGTTVAYGKYGLKAIEGGKLTQKQIESARMVITRHCNRKGKLVIRPQVFFPVTKKPLEVRMGGGKGSVEYMATRVRAGSIVFELDNLPEEVALAALQKAAYKFNFHCKVVCRKFVSLK